MLSVGARFRPSPSLKARSSPLQIASNRARAPSLAQPTISSRSLLSSFRRDGASLFAGKSGLGVKIASASRLRHSSFLRHGSHGHHHSEGFSMLSGQHPQVDPRSYTQPSAEDHEHGTQITIYGIISNILLSVGKGVAGVLGNSTAMIADAVHSLGDLASDVVTLYTHKISAKGPSPSYPYGYGRFDSLGGFVVSLLLVGTGLGIGYHGINELFTVAAEPPTAIALWGAVISVAVKEVLFQMTIKAANKINSKVLIANAWHHRSDAISSGLAFLGIGGEILGIPHMDAVAAIAVSAIIIRAGLPVIRDSLDEITDRNDFVQVDKAIRELATAMNVEVDRLRIRKSGSHLIAEITIIVDPTNSDKFLELTRELKQQVRAQFPIIQDMSIELQERGLEEFHPEHGDHPRGQAPDMTDSHERVARESKHILPKVK